MPSDKNSRPLAINDRVTVYEGKESREALVVDTAIGNDDEVCVSAFGVLSGDWVGRWVLGAQCVRLEEEEE